MTDDQLAAIEARLKAATWNPYAYLAFGFKAEDFEVARFVDADADLIAHAPSDIAALLAEVRRLRGELEAGKVKP